MCGYQGNRTLPFYYASSSFFFVRVPLSTCTRNIPACCWKNVLFTNFQGLYLFTLSYFISSLRSLIYGVTSRKLDLIKNGIDLCKTADPERRFWQRLPNASQIK
jgi:hypothetical protein